MKKIYLNRFALFVALTLLSGSAFAKTSALPGSGTEDEPYLIASYADLRLMSADLNAVYALTADIDASASKVDDQFVWTALGTQAVPFTGKLFGHGHTISHLYINAPTLQNIGLFGYTNGATIDSVGVLQADVTAVGGAGLLIGFAKSTTVNASYATGFVHAGMNSGGLIGFSNASTFTNSFANAEIFGAATTVGGLVGSNNYASVVSGCYSKGTIHIVAPGNAIGGLTGFLSGTILNSFNRTDIVAAAVIPAPALGGLAGIAMNSTLTNSYSTGKIQGSFTAITNVGGAVGLNPNSLSKGTGVFWDAESSGLASANGFASAKSTVELKSAATFSAYNFTEIWKIGSLNDGYPTLIWQTSEAPTALKHLVVAGEKVRIAQHSQGIEIGLTDQALLHSDVRIYALTGKEVYHGVISAETSIIALPAGNYIGKIVSDQNTLVRFKALVH